MENILWIFSIYKTYILSDKSKEESQDLIYI